MGQSIYQYIDQAVAKALAAGRLSVTQGQKDTYRATERRLHALPTIRRKMEEEREDLAQLTDPEQEIPGRSADIVRFHRLGLRLSDEDILAARIADLECRIASKEYEIREIERALKEVEKDGYFRLLGMKFFEGLSDETIAEALHCDPSTVRRNRARLVRTMSVWLYGPEAI